MSLSKRKKNVREQILEKLFAEKGVSVSEFRQSNIKKVQVALIEGNSPANAELISCINQFYEDQLINNELKKIIANR